MCRARVWVWVAAALSCGGAAAAEPEHPAETTARALYAWAIAHPGSGLPDAARQTELAALLTPDLLAQVTQARSSEERCATFTPEGEKPPLYEADLFVDTYEGAQEVALVKSTLADDTASIDARLFSVMDHFPVAHRFRVVTWQDTLTLRLADAAWRVDDIAFASGDTLRERITSYVASNADCETAQ